MRTAGLKVLLVHPRFTAASFWNYTDTCALVGARYPASPLGLVTVAAMLPADWSIRLVDTNVRDLAEADVAWADLALVGAMLPQQLDALRLVRRFHAAGKRVAVGGPDPTSSPHVYASADYRVLGEAESVIDDFIAAIERGDTGGVFEAPKFQADVAASPLPRFDLLDFSAYVHIGVQFSRGCPFTCEFCDIIELYGRRPRTKTADQMLAELQCLYELGHRGEVDFVDDNLIGNKKAVKAFLPRLIAWQAERRYPFRFSTEASLNLADDPELLDLLAEAGFYAVFIGIESPDPDVLAAAQKKQNTRRDIAASVHRIYAAGMLVIAGFIIGFDNEPERAGDGIVDLVEDAAIPVAMLGLLYALPNTQLTRRLAREGRLRADIDLDLDDGTADQCTAGLNFVTLRPEREILADYRTAVTAIFDQEAYLGRVLRIADCLRFPPMRRERVNLALALREVRLFGRMLARISRWHPALRRPLARLIATVLARNPRALPAALMMFALYVHLGPFSRIVTAAIDRRIAEPEGEDPAAPLPRAVASV